MALRRTSGKATAPVLNRHRALVSRPTDQLLAARYEKFRRMGVFLEGDAENGAGGG